MQALTSLPFYLYLQQIHAQKKKIVLPGDYQGIGDLIAKGESAAYLMIAEDPENEQFLVYDIRSEKWSVVTDIKNIVDNLKNDQVLYVASSFAIGAFTENIFTVQISREMNNILVAKYYEDLSVKRPIKKVKAA